MELIILYLILFIASVFDIKTFKIPNLLVLIAAIIGIGFSIYSSGVMGIVYSLFSMLIMFAVFFPIWIFRVMGAGDIKLFMAVSTFPFTFFGEKRTFFSTVLKTFHVSYYSILLAAFIFIFFIPPKQIFKLFNDFFFLIFYKIPLLSDWEGKKLQFSVPILIAFVLYTQHVLP